MKVAGGTSFTSRSIVDNRAVSPLMVKRVGVIVAPPSCVNCSVVFSVTFVPRSVNEKFDVEQVAIAVGLDLILLLADRLFELEQRERPVLNRVVGRPDDQPEDDDRGGGDQRPGRLHRPRPVAGAGG